MRTALSFILILTCSVLSAQDLTILHLNDTHSHIEPEKLGSHKGLGGVIEHAAYIDSVRCADGNSNVLLLHAGDFSQGTSYFTELSGDIEIDVLNEMDFDAVCIGNHEFDNGIDELARRLKNLDVPVLCANYDFSGTSLEGLIKPYVIVEKALRKIGVIGLLTDVATVVDLKIAQMLHYMNPSEVADRYAAELKEQGCELVICLTHIGYDGVGYTDRTLAAETRYVDIVVGGHSHTFLEDMVKIPNRDGKEVIVVTDGKWGRNIGRLAVDFQPNRLTDMYRNLRGQDVFVPGGKWFPYPAYADRKAGMIDPFSCLIFKIELLGIEK